MDENPVLKRTELYSWIKRLQVTRVTDTYSKVSALGLKHIAWQIPPRESRVRVFSTDKSELKSKGFKDMGYYVSPFGPYLHPSLP